MNENNGFILKPEMYNQEEWYEMYKGIVIKYIVLKEDEEVLQSKIDKAIELIEKEDLITYFRETKDLELANEFEDLYKNLKEDK